MRPLRSVPLSNALLAVATALSAMTGCDPQPPGEPELEAPPLAGAGVGELAQAQDGMASPGFLREPPGRQIAVVSCEPDLLSLPQWSAEPVFPATAPAELDKYWLFECSTCDEGDRDALEALLDAQDCLVDLVNDVPASDANELRAQTADPLSLAAGPSLRNTFYAHIGRVADQNLGPRVPVSVGVLDSHNKFNDDNPFTRHGRVMRNIAAAILCPDPTDSACYDDLFLRLALPVRPNGVRAPESGGVVGSTSDLARAIYDAVDQWQADGGERLVINLSVGWPMQAVVPSVPGQLPAPARSVYAAIEYARCQGALVVAASGNHDGTLSDCGETGPLVPAAWEAFPAPSIATCLQKGMGPQLPAGYDVFDGGPLLYGVSGIEANGTPLVTTRAGSRSKLATHAYAAVVDREGGTSQTQAVTGASVAAAVASGTAALVWAHDPTLSPHAVMQHIYDGGKNLFTASEYPVVGGTQPAIHRLSVCGALDHACPVGSSCRGTWSCSPLPTAPLLGPAFAAIDAASAGAPHVTVAASTTATCDNSCNDPVYARMESAAQGGACFDVITVEEEVELDPQPGWSVCPACTLKTEDAAIPMSLGEDYAGYSVVDSMLEVSLADGSKRRYDIGQLELDTTSIKVVEIDDPQWPASTIRRAVLTFVLMDANGRRTQHDGVIPVD